MTDIVERLREHAKLAALAMYKIHICWEAAAEIERLRGRGVFGDDGVPRLVAVDDETDRAEAAEAKLSAAVKALEAIRMVGFADTSGQIARATLKEIGGGHD